MTLKLVQFFVCFAVFGVVRVENRYDFAYQPDFGEELLFFVIGAIICEPNEIVKRFELHEPVGEHVDKFL